MSLRTLAARLHLGLRAALSLALLVALATGMMIASDHGDIPTGITGPRVDANLSDLFAFRNGQNLVLILCSNTAIPPTATSYLFPTDVVFHIFIDTHSMVSNGAVVQPERIDDNVAFRIRFNSDGSMRIQRLGRGAGIDPGIVSAFSGLRDDPFIRGPRQGRNIGAIVLEIPLSSVQSTPGPMLLWATSKVVDFDGPFQDLAGRSLVSMFPENTLMNTMDPRHVSQRMGKPPDVMIYDTSLPAGFPNGRLLTDDVVDLVGDNRVLANDAPFPSTNDKPFLATFPYLAEPH